MGDSITGELRLMGDSITGEFFSSYFPCTVECGITVNTMPGELRILDDISTGEGVTLKLKNNFKIIQDNPNCRRVPTSYKTRRRSENTLPLTGLHELS